MKYIVVLNKCLAFGCSTATGYDKKKFEPTVRDENSDTFHFLIKEEK